jgi:hypothetical protein
MWITLICTFGNLLSKMSTQEGIKILSVKGDSRCTHTLGRGQCWLSSVRVPVLCCAALPYILYPPVQGPVLCCAALQSCILYPPGARTYDHLKKTREEERLKRTMLSEVLQYIQDSSACQQWLRRQADMCAVSQGRRKHSSGILCPSHIFVGIFVGTLGRRVVKFLLIHLKTIELAGLRSKTGPILFSVPFFFLF